MEPKAPSSAPPPRLLVRRLSRRALLLHLAIVGGLVALAWRLFPGYGPVDAALVGAFPYALGTMAVRPLLTWHHRAGVRALRRGRFADAVADFEASLDFFTRHPLLDRYRFVLLLSAGAAGYRELAMCNLAYAHARAGDREAALAWCDRALADYPGNPVASAIRDTLPPGP